jgi:hypothetical protein
LGEERLQLHCLFLKFIFPLAQKFEFGGGHLATSPMRDLSGHRFRRRCAA